MVHDIRSIPPAPRQVRWRKVLGYRWPLGAATFLLAIYGGVLTWMLFLAHGGKAQDDWALDERPTVQAPGKVLAVTPDSGFIDSATKADKIDYEFEHAGQTWRGLSFAATGRFAPGDPTTIELLPGEPNRSRIVGLRTHLIPEWLQPRAWLIGVVVPGLLLGLGYLAGVLHLRRILAHGDVSVATVQAVEPVRFCLPETFAVRFQFRDHQAREQHGRHWVRAHSRLGTRLRTMARHGKFERLPVLHDRRFPQQCRLVLPDDFAPDPRPADPAATIRL
jgi:hypothetical protein